MRILLTDHRFEVLGGAEHSVLALAKELSRRGHAVCAFTTDRGARHPTVARFGLDVITDLDGLAFRPDIIHGQHHFDAMTAIVGLPGVPAVYHCHGASLYDTQPTHPRIYRYIAMSTTLAQRLSVEAGIPETMLEVVPNAVDLQRFNQIRVPARKPSKALLYGTHIRPHSRVAAVAAVAAAGRGLSLDRIGRRFGRGIDDPETVLPTYDIVLASGKSAIDALACGCAVIVVGPDSCGEMVDGGNFARLRTANFSNPFNAPPPSPTALQAQIDRYDADECAAVSRRLRAEAGLNDFVTKLEGIYEKVAGMHARRRFDSSDENRATGRYLRSVARLAHLLDDRGSDSRHLPFAAPSRTGRGDLAAAWGSPSVANAATGRAGAEAPTTGR